MTRKRLWTIVTSILVVGGLVMVFSLNGDKTPNKEEYKAKLLRQEQENIVHYLSNKYENITEIYFDEYKENKKTGYKYIYIWLNKDILIDVTFADFGESDYSVGVYQNGNKLRRRNSGELEIVDNILIKYLGDSE